MSHLEEKQKLSYQGMFYGMQRIDLLTISISGAGVFVVMNTLKFLVENKLPVTDVLKWAGAVFIVSILFNFVSQFFGYLSNKNDYLMYDCEINDNMENHSTYDKRAETQGNWTERFTWSSIVVMFIGLSMLIYYFLCHF